jgi:Spy/CpxP family protein refolding chaperone
MKTFRLLAAAALLTTSAAALAAEDNAGDNAPAEKKICRSERVTGSLTKVKRICMTQAEWDRLREDTGRELNRLNNNQNRFQQPAPAGPVG